MELNVCIFIVKTNKINIKTKLVLILIINIINKS